MSQNFFDTKASLFKVTGSSAERYLQGRCTQDVRTMQAGTIRLALVLSPQGQIEGLFYLLKHDVNVYFIITTEFPEATDKELFIKNILKFKVADQIDIHEVSDSHKVVFSTGLGSEAVNPENAQGKFNIIGPALFCYETSALKTDFQCTLFLKKDAVSFSEVDEVSLSKEVNSISDSEFETIRITAGLPKAYVDVSSATRAPDLPLHSFISKNKGCYAGQEVVEMATARGKPNKKFIKFQTIDKINANFVGSKIFSEDQEVGVITSYESGIGLGFVKNKEYPNGFSVRNAEDAEMSSGDHAVQIEFLS